MTSVPVLTESRAHRAGSSRRCNSGLERAYHLFTDDLLANVDFIDCDFSHANFATCDLRNVSFSHCDLSYTKLPTTLTNVSFTNSTLTRADFSESYLYGVTFAPHNADACLSGATVPLHVSAPCTLPIYYHVVNPFHSADIKFRPSLVHPDLVAIVNDIDTDPVRRVGLLTSATAIFSEHPDVSAASLHALLGALRTAGVTAQ